MWTLNWIKSFAKYCTWVGEIQPAVRPYKGCLQIVGAVNLTYADAPHITDGQQFPIRAEWRGNWPNRLSATVAKTSKVEISTRDKTYVHRLVDFKEILDKSIDKPIVLQYSASAPRSARASINSAVWGNIPLWMKSSALPQKNAGVFINA